MKNTSIYRTKDLAIASYLRLSGFELVEVVPLGRGTGEFVFRDRDDRPKLVLSFLNNGARVDPLAFLNVLKSLKFGAAEAQVNGVKLGEKRA